MYIELSIVIPVFNEEAIVADSVAGLLDRLAPVSGSFEILLAENGSTDGTLEAILDLERRHPEIQHLELGEPNYGAALKAGIRAARGTYVICDEIDLCDTRFYKRAMQLLRTDEADMVIGSKLAPGSADERPWLRHLATQVLNGMLRASLGFKGTDTHGLKAFWRERLLPVLDDCIVDRNLFASEFVIRAERGGLRVCELPVRVVEKRQPTINLLERVPRALANLSKLVWQIRVREGLLDHRPGPPRPPG
ncbi:MAG: glycosyltransferase family 2 protein [Deltaproteobacteria bacterium]|nr:glycosyltransferase family 2 protein [Deltaproteobacteria bacterium]